MFSNTGLLDSRIRNYKRMSERRGVFHLDIGLHMDRQHPVNVALHKRFLLEEIDIGGKKAAQAGLNCKPGTAGRG